MAKTAKKKPAKKGKKMKGLDPVKDFEKPVRKPRQARLPTMDDAKIDIINSLAEDYTEKRDARMRIGKAEVELKGKLLDIMDAQHLTHYHYGTVDVTVQTEKRKVKVRIAKGETDNDEASEEGPGPDDE